MISRHKRNHDYAKRAPNSSFGRSLFYYPQPAITLWRPNTTSVTLCQFVRPKIPLCKSFPQLLLTFSMVAPALFRIRSELSSHYRSAGAVHRQDQTMVLAPTLRHHGHLRGRPQPAAERPTCEAMHAAYMLAWQRKGPGHCRAQPLPAASYSVLGTVRRTAVTSTGH